VRLRAKGRVDKRYFAQYFNDRSYKMLESQRYLLMEDFPVGSRFVQEIHSIRPYQVMKTLSCAVLMSHGDEDSIVPYNTSGEYVLWNRKSRLVAVE
jgi:hypothetical protein